MYIPSTIFREYDIRGIADTDLADPVVVSIGKAFGTWLARKGATRVQQIHVQELLQVPHPDRSTGTFQES
jgi:phosphomannomutase